MGGSKRIGLSLFDEELLSLINASAKIFPITQEMVYNHENPNNFEYGRVDNHLYRWRVSTQKWEYIIADDVDINWNDIKEKPTSYVPKEHTHPELHGHNNKSILDSITQLMINTWNTVTGKADKTYVDAEVVKKANVIHEHDYAPLVHTHPYAREEHNHDVDYYKKTEVDSKLGGKSNTTHDHDGAYYKKAEVDSKLGGKAEKVHVHDYSPLGHDHDTDYYKKLEVNNLLSGKSNVGHKHTEADITNLDKYTKAETDSKLAGKSNTNHGHTELHVHANKSVLDKLIETSPNVSYDLSNLDYIDDIRNGYTEGHAHSNMSTLSTITDILINGWNSAVSHISDVVKHITTAERSLWNTVSGKEDKFTKNSAFNKNFGTTVGTVTQGNDSRLSDARTPTAHDHDILYYKKVEVDTKLDGKSSVDHTHGDKSDAGHTHDDRYYTETEMDGKLASKVDNTTFSGHTGNATVHVTQSDKNNWNGKAELSDIPAPVDISGKLETSVFNNRVKTDVPLNAVFTDTVYQHPSTHPYSMLTGVPTIPTTTNQLTNNSGFITVNDIPPAPPGITTGTVKPTDGSMWYQVI